MFSPRRAGGDCGRSDRRGCMVFCPAILMVRSSPWKRLGTDRNHVSPLPAETPSTLHLWNSPCSPTVLMELIPSKLPERRISSVAPEPAALGDASSDADSP